MNLRELVEQLAEILLARGGDIEVLSEDGVQVHFVEYNDDEGPCVLILFGDY